MKFAVINPAKEMEIMSKRTIFAVIAAIALCALTSSMAFATTTIDDLPDWWKVPGDPPDGVTRTQFHGFHSDPATLPSPDYQYDGFIPCQQDVWNTSAIGMYDVDIAPNPFVANDGHTDDDPWQKGAWIPEAGVVTKEMGNLDNPLMIKEFWVELHWWGADCNDIQLAVICDGYDVVQNCYTITDAMDPNWHVSYMYGTIWPQPCFETFVIQSMNGSIYLDDLWIGTHCVPEPASAAGMIAGCAGLVGLVIRKRK